MRGDEDGQADVFSYVSPEDRIPADHPLRPMRQLVNEALKGMGELFDRMCARGGRPSITAGAAAASACAAGVVLGA